MSAVRLGIDMGSVSTKVAVVRDGAIVKTFYRRHLGRPTEMLALMLARIPSWTESVFSFTGSASRLAAEAAGIEPVNEVVALAEAISRFHPELRSVIEMGGQDSKLLLFRPDGRGSVFDDFAMNSICAAGTGSFLDQQAARLGLDPSLMGELALRCARPPRVAGRCSVFAKSDMIHLQQIGTPPEDIVAGLCLAVARNFKSTIAGGKEFAAPVGFVGGVAANAGMVRAFGEVLAGSCGGLTVPRHFGILTAAGCTLAAKQGQAAAPAASFLEDLGRLNDSRVHSSTHPPLTRHAPKAAILEPCRIVPGEPVYLGIDVGSISTNVVAIDESGTLVAREYLMTAGRPLEAVKKGLGLVADTVGAGTKVLGVGVTGSGRYMTGDFVGADVIRNEITAQARAAVAWDPLVDTVFEIGGQDSKYISISGGRVVDFEMNKVCAAGTGSFLEEQAERLGLSIREFGPLALESHSPAALGERCTVFMDSDVVAHQAAGTSVEDMVGGLSYSIVQNYLHRVVGGRRIGRRILFQGGTAHNKGVVAAFSAVLGRDVSVPDHHDVTGAIGAALLAREEKAGGPSAFRGFETSTQSYTQDSFTCSHCSNSCEIHRVLLEGGRQLFYGGRCERFETARTSPVTPGRNWFPEREEILLDGWTPPAPGTGRIRIGMPRALWFWELFPYFRSFFESMGCDVVLSSPSNSTTVHSGVENTASETCFPVKLAHGHVIDLLERGGIDMLFLPSVTRSAAHPGYRESHSCPYVQGSPWIIDAGLGLTPGRVRVLNPVLDLSADNRRIAGALSEMCTGTGLDPAGVRDAVETAARAQERFERRISEAGSRALSDLGEDGRALVIVSRPYNGCDPMVSGDLAAKLARTGANVMPAEYLDLPLEAAAAIHSNMYWHYGQKILASALAIREDPRLNAVYLTNFGCGPDSFTGHFFEAVMDGKPFLMIETDEHAADAGMITRCEAFLDSMEGRGADGSGGFEGSFELGAPELDGRTIWVPHLGDGTRLIAASARRRGISARPMPQTDAESVALGRSVTSGRECYPAIITSGNMLKVLRDGDPSRIAFFMGTASGPCRFGQYCTYHRMILEKAGYGDVPVVTASSRDSYTSVSGLTGPAFQLDLLRSAVCADVLLRTLCRIRPYARDRAAVLRAYSDSLDIVEEAIEKGRSAVAAMRRAAGLFGRIPLEGPQKPRILVFGEIYVRNDPYANAWTAERIEELGGEVVPTPLSEWFEFVNHCFLRRSKASASLADVAKGSLKGALIHHVKRSVERPFNHILHDRPEPTSGEILEAAGPYMRENIGGEAILCIGAPVAMARRGLIDGAVNVLPFTCLPGTVVAAVSKRIRRDLPDLPWLNLAFDGQEDTDNSSRLEAFMFQVLQRRTCRPGASLGETLPACRSARGNGG